jgi:hypothetical protein
MVELFTGIRENVETAKREEPGARIQEPGGDGSLHQLGGNQSKVIVLLTDYFKTKCLPIV